MPRLTVVAEFKVPQYITADEAVNVIRVEGGSESSRAYRILSTEVIERREFFRDRLEWCGHRVEGIPVPATDGRWRLIVVEDETT